MCIRDSIRRVRIRILVIANGGHALPGEFLRDVVKRAVRCVHGAGLVFVLRARTSQHHHRRKWAFAIGNQKRGYGFVFRARAERHFFARGSINGGFQAINLRNGYQLHKEPRDRTIVESNGKHEATLLIVALHHYNFGSIRTVLGLSLIHI